MPNPLLLSTKSYYPVFGIEDKSFNPKEQVEPLVKSLIVKLEKHFKTLENEIETGERNSFNSIFDHIEQIQHPLSKVWGIVNHLNSVANTPELRNAKASVQADIIDVYSKFSQSKVIFNALENIKAVGIEERVVELNLRDMSLNGIALEKEDQKRFNEIQKELASLSSKFGDNLLDCTKKFELEIDESKLEGVPQSAKDSWLSDGKYVITLDRPSFVSVLKYLEDRSIREKVYRAYVTRAGVENEPIAESIFRLRKEKARLLGFENYAEVSLSSKMANSTAEVYKMIADLYGHSKDFAQKEMDEVQECAVENGFKTKLKPWDISFYTEKLKEKKFNINDDELKQYFAFPNVLGGLFDVANRLFGITIKRGSSQIDVWDPSVMFFNVYDDGKIIAGFYLDPYARPKNKRSGAWMDDCVCKSKALRQNVPIAYLTCNGAKPVGDKPSLMSFAEVETLFHEFGHGLQHMLTEIDIGEISGISGIEWDAVELPSQFMENWCYHKETLYSFAKHYSTGDALPLEMYENLLRRRTFGSGMAMMRQLQFAEMDMDLHSKYDPDGPETIWTYQKRSTDKFCQHNPPIPEDRFLCSFHHIFSSYAAGYYSYKWAEMMSADAFGAFEEVGLDNEEEIQKLGMKFRRTILALGGSEHPSVVYRKFRGKDATVDALLRHNHLLSE